MPTATLISLEVKSGGTRDKFQTTLETRPKYQQHVMNYFESNKKIEAIASVVYYNPKLTTGIITLGVLAALLEGVGLTFILPIIDILQSPETAEETATGIVLLFVQVYSQLGIPFRLGFIVSGVIAIFTIRFVTSFVVSWLRAILRMNYLRYLQDRAFNSALDAEIQYFDQHGSDDVLNAIVTQTDYAGRVIYRGVRVVEMSLLSCVYVIVALVVAPELTVFTLVMLGILVIMLRFAIPSGYELGNDVADANQARQQAVQAGAQGIREVRLFGLTAEIYDRFLTAVDNFTRARILQRRNQAALTNFQNLSVAISIFILLYIGTEFADLSLGSLGVFLFAMFRLGPKAASLNKMYYQVENDLPHLVRTREFIKELNGYSVPDSGGKQVDEIQSITFQEVSFSYEDNKKVLKSIDFVANKGEFISFVGRSGAGKSTIVSLITEMYRPNKGSIYVNGNSIYDFDREKVREKLAVVRQNPYIFNTTLRENITIGNRTATKEDIDRVCRIAKVDEFLDDLSNGYETELGDHGVKLSGGQKQRVSLARALLKDADFLILDEATSDLDSKLEKEVQQSIEDMDQDYGIIAIAHQLSTVENADTIYSLHDGEVYEAGTHTELLEKRGKYHELYSIQSGDNT